MARMLIATLALVSLILSGCTSNPASSPDKIQQALSKHPGAYRRGPGIGLA